MPNLSPTSSQAALSRRDAIRLGAATAAVVGTLSAAPLTAGQNTGHIKKAVKFHMVKEKLSVADKFKLLKDLGYDGVEVHMRDKIPTAELNKARDAADLPIHGVINSSNPDIKAAIDLAVAVGGDSVLVVAGKVDKANSYDKVYRETQEIIRRAISHAEKHSVKILVENVWNNFLLSPMEMARYLDELDSPRVGAYFDVGNVVRFGWPQQWIRILGKRIGKLDIKEYSREKQREEGLWKGFQVKLGEGDCDWPEVREALAAIDYQGWGTAEVPGGGRTRLADIAARMDRVLDL